MKRCAKTAILLAILTTLCLFMQSGFALNYQPDLNGDRFINNFDFAIFASNWQKSGSNLASDIDGSGRVDMNDFAKLSQNWLQFSSVIFVDANAAIGGDGTSWPKAFDFLQDALSAYYRGSDIWVAKGVYKPDANSSLPLGSHLRSSAFKLPDGAEIYGGFPSGGGFWQQRDWVNNKTTLSGDIGTAGDSSDNCYNVVYGANNVVLDGFTICDGNATGTSFGNARGGGIYDSNISNMLIANCTFQNNYSRVDGGAMFNYESSVSIFNCIFNGNDCSDDGAGVYNSKCRADLTNCRFLNNQSQDRGGGVYNVDSNAQLVNCLFNGNFSDSNGRAICNSAETVKMINCTISGNRADGNSGGIYNSNSSSVITNCIVWDNDKEIYNYNSNPHVSFCDVKGSKGSGANWDPNFGRDDGNNIDKDSCFAEGFALKASSPCINAGNNSALPPDVITDINGNDRYYGIVDMGAFEYQP